MVMGFKEMAIGVIPDDWNAKNIVESSTMKARIGWQGLTVAEYLDNGDYYLVTGTDFIDGKIKWDDCHFVDKSRYIQDKNIQLKVGDILVTKDGTIGKIAFVDRLPLPATLNSGVFVIRPKNNAYLSQFLFYIFNSRYFRDFLNKLVAGSTINHLYQKDFINFIFPLPATLKEQNAIATALNDTDKLINQLEKLIAKKRAIKQGAMQQLFKHQKGWKVRRLQEIAYIKGRIGWQGLKQNEFTQKADDPFLITGMNFKEGAIRWDEAYHVSEDRYEIAKEIQLKKGDVLFTKDGTIGKLLYVDNIPYPHKATLNSHLLVFRPLNNAFIPKFLYYQLDSKRFKDFIELRKTGTTFFGMSQKAVADYPMLLPEIKEQNFITNTLSSIDSEIGKLEVKLSKYKMVKQGMMQNLLTGKIRLV